jgi:ribosomal protein S27AE
LTAERSSAGAGLQAGPDNRDPAGPYVEADDTVCPRCGESQELAKVKGCIKCLKCGYKFDCNGW